MQVNDGTAIVGTQDVTFTITGTNDAPVIERHDQSGRGAEVAGDSSAQDIGPITGSFAVTDQDIGDTLTLSVAGKPACRLHGGRFPLENSVDVAALIASGAISFDPPTSNGGADASTKLRPGGGRPRLPAAGRHADDHLPGPGQRRHGQ